RGPAPRGLRVEEEVLTHRQPGNDRFPDAVGADEIDSVIHGNARRAEFDRRTIDPYPPARDAFDAEQCAADLFLAGTAQADEPDDFTRMNAAIDRPDRTDHGTVELEPRGAVALGGSSEDLGRLASDDKEDRLVRRGSGHHALSRDAAVTQHHHPVG